MADYSISAEMTADSSKFIKGVNNAVKSLKSFSKGLADNITKLGKSGLVGAMANVNLAVSGITKSFGTVIKVAKKVGQTINECTEAYKTQAIAERALDTAIQNNPYMTGESSKALKEFASEIQRVSNYGDEELLPLIANLTSLGRTQEEIMQIVQVATDMASTGTMSLDTAITQLNATLNGNIGRLGQQNAELKNLTEEELQSGKAIEILGEKFKGLSSATVDTSKQLKNIKGDFKEAIGQFTLPSSDMWNKFWVGFYDKGIKVITALNKAIDTSMIGKNISNMILSNANEVAKAMGISTEEVMQDIGFIDDQLKAISSDEISTLIEYIDGQKNKTEYQKTIIKLAKHELKNREYQKELEEKQRQEEEKRKALLKDLEEKEKGIAKLKQDHLEKIEAQKKSWENIEKVTGQVVTDEEKLKFYQDDLVAILNEANGQITEENEYYKTQKKIIEDLIASINGQVEAEEEVEEAIEETTEAEEIKQLTLKETIGLIKEQASEALSTAKMVLSTIGGLIKKAVQGFKKMIELDPDEILDTLLVVEDKILTFFVETLPKLPSVMSSAITSAVGMMANIDWGEIALNFIKVIQEIIASISENIDDFTQGIFEIIDGMLLIITEIFSDSSFFGKIFASITNLLMKIVVRIIQILPSLIRDIGKGLISALTGIIESISTWLPALFKYITGLVPELISAIFDITLALIEAIPQILDSILRALPELIPVFVENIIKVFIEILSSPAKIIELAVGIVSALIKACASVATMIPEVIAQLVASFVSLFTGNEEWDNVGGMFANIWAGVKTSFTNMVEGIKNIWNNLINWFQNAKSKLSSAISGAFSGVKDKVKSFWTKLTGKGYAVGTNFATSGLHLVGEAGPELVRFRGGEQVLNTKNTQKALAGIGNSTNNFNVTFNNLQDTSAYAMLNQLKQYNRQMSINGIL